MSETDVVSHPDFPEQHRSKLDGAADPPANKPIRFQSGVRPGAAPGNRSFLDISTIG
jgi:hypothetical protein